MRRVRSTLSLLATVVLAGAGLGVVAVPAAATPFGYASLNPIQRQHVSGLLATVLNADDPAGHAQTLVPRDVRRAVPATSCANRFGDNVKVNQNCLNLSDTDLQGRGQSQNETWLSADPNNPAHLVASYNDYPPGDGNCGVSYSLDGGSSWADSTVPNGFTRGHRVRWRSPSVLAGRRRHLHGVGHKGNAYLSCQVFDRGAGTSANPISPARSTSSGPPAPTVRPSTSPAGPSPSTTTPPAPGTSCWTSN